MDSEHAACPQCSRPKIRQRSGKCWACYQKERRQRTDALPSIPGIMREAEKMFADGWPRYLAEERFGKLSEFTRLSQKYASVRRDDRELEAMPA